jgi:broad specificity polyphosphatase/5'/3'-nucleotidase SurE
VTNHDGITEPVLLAHAVAIRNTSTESIITPDRNWSRGSHVKTLDRTCCITRVQLADGTTGMASDGALSDFVALALLGYITPKLDLVISGSTRCPTWVWIYRTQRQSQPRWKRPSGESQGLLFQSMVSMTI